MAKFVHLPIFDEESMPLEEYLQIDVIAFFNVPWAKVVKFETEEND